MASRADLRREKGLKTDSLSQGVSLAGPAKRQPAQRHGDEMAIRDRVNEPRRIASVRLTDGRVKPGANGDSARRFAAAMQRSCVACKELAAGKSLARHDFLSATPAGCPGRGRNWRNGGNCWHYGHLQGRHDWQGIAAMHRPIPD
jgi:hypothetical protein